MCLTSRDYGKESGQKIYGEKSSEEDQDLHSEKAYKLNCKKDCDLHSEKGWDLHSEEDQDLHSEEGWDFQGKSRQDCPARTQVGGQGFCHKAPHQRILGRGHFPGQVEGLLTKGFEWRVIVPVE